MWKRDYVIEDGRAGGNQFVGGAGKEAFQCSDAAGEHYVDVMPLRDSGTGRGRIGDVIFLENCDSLAMRCERSGREEPRDPASNHDGVAHQFMLTRQIPHLLTRVCGSSRCCGMNAFLDHCELGSNSTPTK